MVETAAAVAELRELAVGRADLLTEVAGILEGASDGELDEPFSRQAAALCRAALPPFSGGLRPRQLTSSRTLSGRGLSG